MFFLYAPPIKKCYLKYAYNHMSTYKGKKFFNNIVSFFIGGTGKENVYSVTKKERKQVKGTKYCCFYKLYIA